MRVEDLVALGAVIDEETEGAIFALRTECDTNGWTPHIWAQTPAEGSPPGLTRLLLYGDSAGTIKYWDSVLIRDATGTAAKIKVAEQLQPMHKGRKASTEMLRRLN